MKKVALIRGHNKGAQGAVNYKGQSEWQFHAVVIPLVIAELKKYGIEAEEYLRPSGIGYSGEVKSIIEALKADGHTLAVEFHFNATVGAKGCEVLIAESATVLDEKFADVLTDNLNEKLGIVERAKDGVLVVKDGHRGAEMIYGLKRAGITSCILEPCFAHEYEESKAVFEYPERYAKIVAESIARGYFDINEIPYQIDLYKESVLKLNDKILELINTFNEKDIKDSNIYKAEYSKINKQIRELTFNFYLEWK